MPHATPTTLRQAWRSLADNAAAAAAEAQTPTPAAEEAQRRRLQAIVQGAALLKSERMAPGEGASAACAGRAFLELVAAWGHAAVAPERRAMLAPFVAAGAGCVLDLMDEAAAALRRTRADLDA